VNIEPLDVFRCDLSAMSLIEASAGTGKTWNICALFMRLLLQRRLDVAKILVVTFTNAATAELRDRIRGRIAETLAQLKGAAADVGDDFVRELLATLPADPAVIADLKHCLEQALQRFDEASIFTIHGFCERALRDTPLGAGMPMSMELVTDESTLPGEVAGDFWRRRIAVGELAPGLAAFMVDARDSPDKLATLLEQRIAKPLATLRWPDDIDSLKPADLAALQGLFDAAHDLWRRDKASIVAVVTEALGRLKGNRYKPDTLAAASVGWDAFFAAGNPVSAPGKGEKLGLLTSRNLQPNKGKAPPGDHEFFHLAETLLDLRAAARPALHVLRCRLLRELLAGGPEALRIAKRDRRVMSFDDLLYNLHERLMGDQYPWLASLLRSRYPAALIDEFQDTDPVQFGIFHRIYSAPGTTLFLVGDPKQAIYSFRNADLRVYLHARGEASRIYTLADNQRCSRALLSGLNLLFGNREQEFMVEGLDYVPLTYGRKARTPFVDITERRAPMQLWSLPCAGATTLPGKSEAKSRAAHACAAEIARLLAAGRRGDITLDDEDLQAGDIAVLVRTHKEGLQMRMALAALSVGSVELSRTSIFRSAEATELERILAAIIEPMRATHVRAAKATVLMGGSAESIAALSADDAEMFRTMAQFAEYREKWLQRGAGVMLRQLMIEEKMGARLLSLPFGERRLTNWLHLIEALHAAEVHRAAPEVLLSWLQGRLSKDAPDEAAELRLESERNLVQIVTIHRAKGLEYPVVFCPFLWDGFSGRTDRLAYGCERRDEAGALVMDFRLLSDEEKDLYKSENAADRLAERLRMIYVALTRAKHRCYVVVGNYLTRARVGGSSAESCRAALSWLAAGAGMTPAQWRQNKLSPDEIDAAWQALAQRSADSDGDAPAIGYAALPSAQGVPLLAQPASPQSISIPDPPSRIPPGWRLGSYSQLIHGASGERTAVDHDLRAASADAAALSVPEAVAAEDIVRFPRGMMAGHCIHAIFETVDFQRSEGWSGSIAKALRDHPQTPRQGNTAAQLPGMLANMLKDVLQTPLPGSFKLADVPRRKRLVELKFSLPAAHITHPNLRKLLERHGYAMPALNFPELHGYLNGAIDLVFEAAGQFWVLDWKSNFLGASAAHYEAAALQAAMEQHYYHLQYLLYTVALHRLLQRRMPEYAYERHFGGALYLFVRGVRPGWVGPDGRAAGVFAARPPQRLIEDLSALMDRARDAA
jgi:exodeoxyribonuclease V beta subunit